MCRWQKWLTEHGTRGLEESNRKPKLRRMVSCNIGLIDKVQELRELYRAGKKEKLCV